MFNIWNLYFSENNKCEFDVTPANMPLIGKGSIEWITKCFEAFDLDCEIHSWKVYPFRSQYFSDYLDSEDWRDRWQECWHFIVTVSGELPKENTLQYGPFHVDMLDPTWEFGYIDPGHDERAILIFNQFGGIEAIKIFAKELIEKSVVSISDVQMLFIPFVDLRFRDQKRNIETSLSNDSSEAGGFQSYIRRIINRSDIVHQARILFNAIRFPESVDTLDSLLRKSLEKDMWIDWRTTTSRSRI